MNKFIYKLAIVTLLLVSPIAVYAEYCATGKIEGNVCKGFILESCKFVKIDAVKNSEGKLFTVNKCYPDVTEYSEGKGRCWIHTKYSGGGLMSWAVNSVAQPEFLHKNESGEYEDIDVEYITFQCIKR